MWETVTKCIKLLSHIGNYHCRNYIYIKSLVSGEWECVEFGQADSEEGGGF